MVGNKLFLQIHLLTIAEISFMLCKYSTILDLWAGSTRENRRALAQAARCSLTERSSNSRPEKDLPVVSSSSVNTPIRLEIQQDLINLTTRPRNEYKQVHS